ncbi:MAG: hypothetical protein HOL08_13115 [Opitutae bacterium]|nr:hypothetical protein [Opitutae bacterium]
MNFESRGQQEPRYAPRASQVVLASRLAGALVVHLLQYDTNGDGRIEPRELLGLIHRADLNKDGVLDREEMEAIDPPAQGRKRPSDRP